MSSDQIGRYRLIQPIAEGGMAQIYLARQEGPGGFEKTVVIKKMRPHLARDPEFMTMFMNEARLVARLSHPNIVQVLDFGELDGSYFLCMEWLVGGDLDQILTRLKKREQVYPAPVAAVILSAVCDALHYAHNLKDAQGTLVGLVHRDLSPQNIFVTTQGAVKVLDFGIVKMAGRGHETRAGIIKGKPYYLSPEQVRVKPLDGRSDLFALGAVLYELVTGVRPFERDDEYACMHAILEEPIPPPRTLAPALPEKLEQIIMKALERDVEKRYADARTMRTALDSFVASFTTSPATRQLQNFMEDLWTEAPAAAPAPAAAAPESPPAPPEPPRAPSVIVESALADPEELLKTRASLAPPQHAPDAEGLEATVRRPDPDGEEPTVRKKEPQDAAQATRAIDVVAMAQAKKPKRGPWLPLAGILALFGVAFGGWWFVSGGNANPPAPAALPKLPETAAAPPPPPAPAPPPVVEAAPPPPAPEPPPAVEPPPPPPPPEHTVAVAPHVAKPKHGEPAKKPPPPPLVAAPPTGPTGLLNVNCIPWCQVWVDDSASPRNSPVLGLALAPGTHHVRVRQPDSAAEQTKDVDVEAGQTAKAIIRF